MLGFRVISAAVLTVIGLAEAVTAAEPKPPPAAGRAAVNRALPLLQKTAAEYARQRQCFSCHHQALPVLALATARARGFRVDEGVLQKQVAFTLKSLANNRDGYQKGRGQGGQVATAGYALWALEAGGWKPDATTAAVAEYLLLRDKKLNYWKVSSSRPPSEASDFNSTYLALRGLRAFGTPEQKQRIAERVERVRDWLLETPAADTEDRAFRLWALKLAGAAEQELHAARKELQQGQRKDGGFAQTDRLASDAYATGSALVALHEAGGLATDDPVYQRGLQFLIKKQRPDGSWLVASRSRPFQVYFESGFPHGKDQFISAAASGWAATALALACPVELKPTAPAK
jgi:hypothetical protein